MTNHFDSDQRLLLILIALGMVLLGATAFMWSAPHKHPGPMTAPSPAPFHVEWEEYPVGGYLLAKPDTAAEGWHTVVRLPAGSLLEVPREVEGWSPDSLSDRRRRTL